MQCFLVYKHLVQLTSILKYSEKPQYLASSMNSRSIPSKKPLIALSVSQNNKGLHNFLLKQSKQRVEIYDSCRIFRNYKTHKNKFLTLQDAKKGRIPTVDHNLIVSIDAINTQGNQIKYRLNKSYETLPNLPNNEVFLSLRNYSYYYQRVGYKLNEGDIIKFGSKRIKVITIKNTKTFNIRKCQMQSEQEQIPIKSKAVYYQKQKIEGACKICLSEDLQQNDFLIAPCQCKGSCANVHFECLKKWISNKVVSTQTGKIISYSFKNFKCEICKTQLPKTIIKQLDKHNYLFNIRLPSKNDPYMILQLQNEPLWHVVTLKEKETVQIGRSMSADLVLWQQFISRMHAQMCFVEGNFYIKDLHSQYGTFIKLNSALDICYPIQFQVGNTFFEMRFQVQNSLAT